MKKTNTKKKMNAGEAQSEQLPGIAGTKSILPPNPSTASDPVLAHANELANLRAAERALDHKLYESGDYPHKIQHANDGKNIVDKIVALEELISCEKASNVEGSLVHVALIFNFLNYNDTCEIDEATADKSFRACCRMLYSVRDVLQSMSNGSLHEVLLNDYMGDIQNPWLNAEERIGGIESDRLKQAASPLAQDL